ncbi:GNAT family N-acetyltransferase [Marinomonas balearica]|uniref:Ribosomal protein S18 acetylase RimI-like enzyme n=1 Tax=Marinomonas balearica TaxID=491947 RepID=A0A4R6MB89_9GAMM|nr:GNAT family N-acetyltransferase [Marinomonas balearica]TDO98851.1 ribosomal protein S18 acetylase RimI-like enzyme [Marinomonas balearica]
MSNKNFSIKTMTAADLHLAVEWAAFEGWNPGLHDATLYYAADPSGFLMGYLGDEPIGCISVVKYNDSFGFLGFYIVKPEYRGQGYGIQLWKAGLRYLEGCNIGLDGVLAQQENYKKFGFKFAYSNIRFEGEGGVDSIDPPRISGLVRLEDVPFDTVQAYESPFFPAARAEFSQLWIQQTDAEALGIVEDNELVAMGVIRKCRNGYKIGPLYGNTPELAETLFLSLKAHTTKEDRIFLDVPEINESALSLAERYNMQPSFETARMYTGDFPPLPFERFFGVASFEIG